jgi:hypothetical protein
VRLSVISWIAVDRTAGCRPAEWCDYSGKAQQAGSLLYVNGVIKSMSQTRNSLRR